MRDMVETEGTVRQVTDALARVAYRGAYRLAMAYWFVRRPQTQGVLVGVWCGRRVLLLQNSYKRQFSLPGGGLHRGEPLAAAGAREMREEVGLTVDASRLKPVLEVEDTAEFKLDRIHFFELDVDTEPPLALDQREVVWAAFLDADAALRLPLTSPVRTYLQDAVQRRLGPELLFIHPEHPLYPEELELRFRVLREPLGFPRSAVRFSFEADSLHLVARQGEAVIGCVLFHPENAHSGRLFQMAVTPSLQGRGLGARLVTTLEAELRRRGFTHVHLHARAQVVPFYERLGYAVYGEPFTEVGIPHRHMQKTLSASSLVGQEEKA